MLHQHPEIVEELSRRLHLRYLEMKNDEGNVCFTNSEEVRAEFREVFTSQDVICYLIGLFKTSTVNEIAKENFHMHFPYPGSADFFWQQTEQGRFEKL